MFPECCALATRMLQGKRRSKTGHGAALDPRCVPLFRNSPGNARFSPLDDIQQRKRHSFRTRCPTPFRSDALKTRSTRGNAEAARCGHSRTASSAGDDVDQRAKTCIERGFPKQAPLERRRDGHGAGMEDAFERPIPGCRVASGYSSTSSPKHSGIWKLGVSLSMGFHER